MSDSRLTYDLAFSMMRGVGLSRGRQILDAVGSTQAFFEMPHVELCRRLQTEKILSDNERMALLERGRREHEYVQRKNISTAFFSDDNYPRRLAMCDDAPTMLYATGNMGVLDSRHIISIVGTRNATTYGAEVTADIVGQLATMLEKPLIVSGLAYGIDILAHRAALNAGTPTAGIVAHGLNTIYPADHRSTAVKICNSGGAIVTEYPSDSPIHKGNFLARNRIVAGLADVTIVVESDSHGGALVTARIADAYGRHVMAVPGRVTDRYSRGCNDLIARNVANIIRDASDLVKLLGWDVKPAAGTQRTLDFPAPTGNKARVVDHLRSHPDHTINDMAPQIGIPFPELSALLMEMEMEDMLTSLPGGRFSLKI